MKNFHEKFEVFGALLEEHPEKYACMSFVDICRTIGADPAAFGRYVYSQVGMTGEEVLELYRKTACADRTDG